MNKLMWQQVMTAPGQIEFRQIPVPKPDADQVLVKIRRIGICGSDMHVYHGLHPFTKYPVTQGHEVSGEIVDVGSNVKDRSIGQKVTIEPQVTCGVCHPCRHGKYNLCEELKVMGFQTTGTASEYFAVDAAKTTPLPDDMTFEQGAMLEPLSVAVHAVRRYQDIENADVIVIGCGPIGLLIIQTAKALGARSVLASDISDYRLNIAKNTGADFIVNSKKQDFGEAVKDAFGPDKADVIYDCAGNNTTMGQAIKYARKGSVIVLVAVFSGMANVDLAVLNDHELTLDTTMMYRHDDYLTAIELVEKGKIQLEPLLSKRFSFDKYLEAYKYIENNTEEAIKVMIDVDSWEHR